MWRLFLASVLLVMFGCGEPAQPPPSTKLYGADLSQGEQTIEPYNPDSGEKILEPKAIGADNPNTAYGQMWRDLDPSAAIEAYKKDTGNYPKDVNEFISEVMVPNDIKFPNPIAPGFALRYHEAEHRVVIVSLGKGKPRGR